MKVTDLALRLRTSVIVLSLMVAIGGAVAYFGLPKESAPSIEIPTIIITTIYPGASPSDVENLLTRPIEREIQRINGIEVLRSTSTEGVSTVVVEFSPDVAMSEATQHVREKVDLAKAELPPEVEEPIVSEIDISEFPIVVVNLAADFSLARLKKIAEDLEDRIEGVPSVLEVDLIGGRERELQVQVELSRLQAYELAFNDVIDTLNRENANIPSGSIDVDHLNYLVRVDAQFRDPQELMGLVIKSTAGKPIRVGDVARVQHGFKDRASYASVRVLRKDGPDGPVAVPDRGYLKVISLNVKKRPGANIIETTDAVKSIIGSFPFPEGAEVLLTGDQSKEVRTLVRDLENNIISGLIFVVAVLLFFLGLRTSLLVGIAIPLSMMVTFMVLSAMGHTLNFIILFSLIIALGMLVDNAVVIVENIYRFLEMGHPPFEAAKKGTEEVGMAVVASTATTVAAFLPMMFWPGLIGQFMSYMPMTLIITLTSSLFVALIINPVITAYFARVDGEEREGPGMALWARASIAGSVLLLGAVLGRINPTVLLVLGGGAVLTGVLWVLILRPIARGFVGKGLPLLVETYRRFIQWMLRRDYDVRFAYARNMTGLLSLALAPLFAVAGGLAYLMEPQAGLMLLYPAGALGALGLAGVVLHSVESLLAGGLGLMLRRPVRLILTDNRARLLNLVLGFLIAIAGTFVVAPTGVAFFPDTDPNQVQVHVNAELGTHLDASKRLADVVRGRIDGLLSAHERSEENVDNLVRSVGVGGDAMFGGGSTRPETSIITLNMASFEHRSESTTATLGKLRDSLEGVPGADIEIKRDQAGPPTGPPVNIEISGPRFDEIVRIARSVKGRLETLRLEGTVPGMVDIRDNLDEGRPELGVRIDRARAARFGLNPRQIAVDLRTAVNGSKAGTFRDGEDEYDITVRLRPEDRRDLESLRNLTFMHEGDQIPIVTVAEFEPTSGLGSITRKDAKRVVTVMANVRSGVNAQETLGKVREALADIEGGLPPGYSLGYTGESEDQQKSFAFLGKALGIGAALITMILIAQFNSVIGPFIIMLAVSLSMIGVLLGLVVNRMPFGLMTFIGVISLAGIVVNNNIVLIDYIVQLRDRGLEKTAAIVEGGATRLRPVLLTAMTTVLGLIPLTYGINIDFVGLATVLDPDLRIGSANTQFWGPMGITIVSGLTFATFLTLVIVPVLYSVMDSLSVRLRRGFGGEA